MEINCSYIIIFFSFHHNIGLNHGKIQSEAYGGLTNNESFGLIPIAAILINQKYIFPVVGTL